MNDAGVIRVLLADDEHLIRGALAALLSLEDDLLVVAEAASGLEALAMARAHRPDVAVLDLQMPGRDGVGVAADLRSELPDCRTMIVTSHGRPGHLKRALEAGARGFVPKTASAQQLAEIIRSVHGGTLDQGAVLKHKIDYSIAHLFVTSYFLHKFNNIF
ncbi:response regulator [Staphylococcus capitis]|uniref:response regulator n=1 Tax=Staphylococcus capitis TaxID=29388 RepID=UPI003D068660